MPAARLVFVGGGPKTTGLLLALAAAARADRAAFPETVEVVVVDPFPAGGGRIWRHAQSPVLWMNSLASDVSIFPDADASVPAPPFTGPSLAEWAAGRDLTGLGVPGAGLGSDDFAPRRVQAEYLGWAFDRALRALPAGFSVETVRGHAVGAEPCGSQHIVAFEDGRTVLADSLVLAQGFLEVSDSEESAGLREQAVSRGLGYVAPGYTADLDLSALPAGEDVIVRGLGLAFIDAMMMLSQGRGGRFERVDGGTIVYHPSGNEPVLWAGSGRGVPYKSKLGHRPEGLRIGPTRWLTEETVLSLRRPDGTVSCDDVVFPLLEAELATAHYVELATRYEGRTRARAAEFLDRFAAWHRAFLAGDAEDARRLRDGWIRFAQAVVPDPADRFDLAWLDRPFAGRAFGSQEEFEAAASAHAQGEVARAADARFSQDSAVFFALVSAYYVTRELVSSGVFAAEDRIRNVDGRFHGLFSYIASGPPPERLENLLALHRAGIVRFLGAEVEVTVEDVFVARSGVHPEAVRARWLLDAHLAPVSAARAKDPLLRGLLDGGYLLLEGGGGRAAKLVVDARGRAVGPDGGAHTGLFLVGPSVAGSTAEAFSRPGIDARVFRDNARLAGEIRDVLRDRCREAAVQAAPAAAVR